MIKILLGILCIIGILLIILLLCAVVLIFCKICVIIRYTDKRFVLALKIGFFEKQLIPGKKKEKSSRTVKQKKESRKSKGKKELTVLDYIDITKKVLDKICTHIHFNKLHVDFRISGTDAAQTAIQYGRINAAIYPLASLIYERKRFKDLSIQICPDFLAKESVYNVDIILYTRSVFIIKGLRDIAKYFI